MSGFKQPWLGISASALMIVLAFLAILPWNYATFGGVVADFMMCSIPFTIVVGGFWQGQEPKPIAGLPQPIRGIAYLVLAAIVAFVVFSIESATVGGGKGATPFLAFGIILSVVVTFWLVIMWGGWPFNLIKNKLVGGLTLLVAAYVLTGLFLRTFNFAFLAQAPFYPGMDPAGPIPAWDGLVAAITCLAVMFLFLHFDLWPLTTFKGVMQQPVLGIVWTVVGGAIGWGLYYLGTGVLKMAPYTFMVTVPIPFIFGSILLLNMMGGSLTGSLKGVAKGLVSAVLAAVIGSVLAQVYAALMPALTKDVPAPAAPAGPLDQNLWLASALLAVTFPFLAMYGDFFHLWPLAPKAPAEDPQKAAEPAAR